jgi:hypothetical protein
MKFTYAMPGKLNGRHPEEHGEECGVHSLHYALDTNSFQWIGTHTSYTHIGSSGDLLEAIPGNSHLEGNRFLNS